MLKHAVWGVTFLTLLPQPVRGNCLFEYSGARRLQHVSCSETNWWAAPSWEIGWRMELQVPVRRTWQRSLQFMCHSYIYRLGFFFYVKCNQALTWEFNPNFIQTLHTCTRCLQSLTCGVGRAHGVISKAVRINTGDLELPRFCNG